MGWFRRAQSSDHYNNMSDEEKQELAAYAEDPAGYTLKAQNKIVANHLGSGNETDETDDDSSSGGGGGYTTDYSEYGDGLLE